MADNEPSVDVEVSVPVDTDETSHDETAGGVATAATDHVIDAAVDSEVAAAEARDQALESGMSAIDAENAASDARTAAAQVSSETATLAQIAADLRATAEAQARAATAHSTNEAVETELGEPISDPTIDVAPDSTHWLNRKWNLFGKGKTEVSE